MKKILLIIFCVSITTVALANSKILDSFKATANNSDAVNIEWSTNSETNVLQFEVERSSSTAPDFRTIKVQKANGRPSTYKYTDSDSFIKESMQDELQSGNTVKYRIKIVYTNSQTAFSDEVDVLRSNSSVRRTLGMIKEMFR